MFERLLLGHLLGDYLLQNEWMGMTKSKPTLEGWIAAFVHCLLYTFAVCLFMWNFDLIWIVTVFLSHFVIDKFMLGEKYLKYVKGGGLKKYIDTVNWTADHSDVYTKGNQMLSGGFNAVVYTVTDNSMHLIIMYLFYQIIY